MESIRVINRGGRQKFQRSRAQADQERAKFRVEVIEVKTHTPFRRSYHEKKFSWRDFMEVAPV